MWHLKEAPRFFTVRFDSQGGSHIDDISVTSGSAITLPPAPTRSGHRFDGWYTDITYTTRWNFADPVHMDMTLYAKWIQEILAPPSQSVTVRFDSQGGSHIDDISVTSGSAITLPPAPTRSDIVLTDGIPT